MKEEEFDNDLDRMLREKLSQKEFMMKASWWDDARKLIDEDRKKRNGFVFFISIFLLAGMGGIVTTLVLTGYKDKNTVSLSAPVLRTEKAIKASALPLQAATAGLPENQGGRPVERITSEQKKPQAAEAPGEKIILTSADEIPLSVRTVSSHTPSYEKKESKSRGASTVQLQDLSSVSASVKKPEPGPENNFISNTSSETATPLWIQIRRAGPLSIRPLSIPAACDSCHHDLQACVPDSMIEPDPAERSFLAIEAGITSFNSPFSTTKPEFMAGLNYARLLRPGIYLNAGLRFSRLQQHLGILRYEKVSYSFGRNIERTSIETPRLDYLQLPVYVSCRISGSHYLTAGFTYSYLIHSSNRVTVEKGNEQAPVVRKDEGYTYALNKQDVQLTIGYSMLLPNRFNLSFVYGYGLTDISRNSKFHSSAFDRNQGFMLGVGYKILER
jgi:hypothetical protein